MRLSFHAWPLGVRYSVSTHSRSGVLCVDEETGVAVVVNTFRSQMANQKLAEERVKMILEMVNTW